MKKINILQMPVRNAKGGITQYALRNWEHINKNRFMFDWVTLDKELSFEPELTQQSCKVHHLSCRQEDDKTRFCAEMNAILKCGYDAIHLHTSFWRGFLVEELAIEAGIPKIIVHAHSSGIDAADPVERANLLSAHNDWKNKFNTELATHFTACSAQAADFLFGSQIPKQKIIHLKNAIYTEKFAFNEKVRKNTREQMGLDGKFVILQSARLVYQKNPSFTLEVLSSLSEQLPNALLLFAGDGDLRGSLEKDTERLGLSEKIRFLGFRPDIPELLNAADLVLMPSHFEGLSISAIEAQCSGIFCVLSEHVSNETVITDCALRLPLDINLWRETIIDAARNGYKRRGRSNELAAAGYSLAEQIKILEGVYSGGE